MADGHAFTDRAGRHLWIREVVEEDAAAILAFTQAVDAESTYLSREPSESPKSLPLERQRISQIRGRPGSTFLAAFDGDVLVGTIDFHGGTRRRTAHAGEFGLAVRKPYWGSGVGGHLLDCVIAWARAGGLVLKIKLRVQATNTQALRLYTSRGFVEEGRFHREQRVEGRWVDLLAMALWLDPPLDDRMRPPTQREDVMPQTLQRIEDPAQLAKLARGARRDILEMIGKANSGHPGGSLSAIDLITVLYYAVLRHDPQNPTWVDRDRFILSKGHACPALYAVLGEQGYFDKALFGTLRQLGSPLQGHPELGKLAGIEASTGSLGQGLSIGVGMAEAARIAKRPTRVFVLTGDGELDEGQVWEAAMFAGAHKVDNLVCIVDNNRMQLDNSTDKILPLEPLADKWKAFNWNVIEIDGHDHAQILDAYKRAEATKGTPSVIIAHTIKGKGVSFMENQNEWHGTAPNADQLKQALAGLAEELTPNTAPSAQ